MLRRCFGCGRISKTPQETVKRAALSGTTSAYLTISRDIYHMMKFNTYHVRNPLPRNVMDPVDSLHMMAKPIWLLHAVRGDDS